MNIDICICTYRRPHVAETMRSLASLKLKPDWQIRIIVADNDEKPSAQPLVEAAASECALNVTYIHAPARNISIARNACLDAATAPLIAFIDDDELAEPNWLNVLMTVMESSKPAAVLGPVHALYGPDAPAWMRRGDFHSVIPVWVRGEIITGYSGNSLLQKSAIGTLRFRKDLGRTGGEDTVFFTALHQAGGTIAYAPDAVATEIVPKERASLRWLINRHFRGGQTHGFLLLEKQGTEPLTRAKNITLASVKSLFCFVMMVPHIMQPARMNFWFLRGAMHAGVVARLLGKQEIEQYG